MLKFSLMATSTKVNTKTVNSMEKASIFGRTALVTKVNSTKESDTVKEAGNQPK